MSKKDENERRVTIMKRAVMRGHADFTLRLLALDPSFNLLQLLSVLSSSSPFLAEPGLLFIQSLFFYVESMKE